MDSLATSQALVQMPWKFVVLLLFQVHVIWFPVDVNNIVRIRQEGEIENAFARWGSPYVAEDLEPRLSRQQPELDNCGRGN